MKRYSDYEQLRADYPGTCQMIDEENKRQYPSAKFVEAAVGGPIDPGEDPDLMVLFDVEVEGELLWVWCCGEITDDVPNRGAFIDEYYTVPTEDAKRYLTHLK